MSLLKTPSLAVERWNSHESAVIMDRRRTDWNRNQRCDDNNSVTESEYDVVDDQEELLNVHILPARPLYDERDYADRDIPRSSSSQSLSSLSTGNSNTSSRKVPPISGPAINRDLKPSRRKTVFDERATPEQPGDQHSDRHFPAPPPFFSELVNLLPELTLRELCMREERTTEKTGFSPHSRGLQCAERVSAHHYNERHCLDLETNELEKRSRQSLERVPSKHHHHEWPQSKEEVDQHDFVPMGKPQQTYTAEDWYVGACSRADAEHALHLVNKDGAFLVRDCSMSTNSEPLVLAVYHEKKVYNVKIRFIESMRKYALGTRQRSIDMFDSVPDIIKFHSIFPIILISGRNTPGSRYSENCVLTCPVTKTDVDQLLQ
uniref:cytokine-dependent hematopoietic cell linker isoform X2 n=1 Tax=Scatophagus argus TaxID=75038 RepID=UPI001ED81F10|nr:cytokine-dependent hematopoietic cell linker isoform X2 [Scatophagus argus]